MSKDVVRAGVIVPAYHEAANLGPLITRVFKALEASPPSDHSSWDVQLIVVDDNSKGTCFFASLHLCDPPFDMLCGLLLCLADGTEEVVGKQSETYNAQLITRTTERGLSSAVLRGFDEACKAGAEYLLCMDADLQHPPEKVQHYTPLCSYLMSLLTAGGVDSVCVQVPDLLRAMLPTANSAGSEFVLGTRYGAGVAIDANWPLYRRVISKGARLLAHPLTPLSDPMVR
jgi:dolichol-phosphate mannosyltransferase